MSHNASDTWNQLTGDRVKGRSGAEVALDPLGVGAHQNGADANQQGLNRIDPFHIFHNDHQAQPDGTSMPAPPTMSQARGVSVQEQLQTIQRRSAYRTLFTGGQGLIESPSTASTTLLGN